jgi:hypothetical protein
MSEDDEVRSRLRKKKSDSLMEAETDDRRQSRQTRCTTSLLAELRMRMEGRVMKGVVKVEGARN